jgi:hypothetical protein
MILVLSIAAAAATAAAADDKEKEKRFAPGPASSYAAKQTNTGITIAVDSFESKEKAKLAFGKVSPYEEGVLPVLVVIQNDSKQAVRVDSMQAEYISADRQRIEATPPDEVKYVAGGRPVSLGPSRIPGDPRTSRRRKNKLDIWEIEGRAFSAKMLPPGESAHGFVYFRAAHRTGAKLYINGLREAATGKDLFYFEIPFE